MASRLDAVRVSCSARPPGRRLEAGPPGRLPPLLLGGERLAHLGGESADERPFLRAHRTPPAAGRRRAAEPAWAAADHPLGDDPGDLDRGSPHQRPSAAATGDGGGHQVVGVAAHGTVPDQLHPAVGGDLAGPIRARSDHDQPQPAARRSASPPGTATPGPRFVSGGTPAPSYAEATAIGNAGELAPNRPRSQHHSRPSAPARPPILTAIEATAAVASSAPTGPGTTARPSGRWRACSSTTPADRGAAPCGGGQAHQPR